MIFADLLVSGVLGSAMWVGFAGYVLSLLFARLTTRERVYQSVHAAAFLGVGIAFSLTAARMLWPDSFAWWPAHREISL